ncbi:Negative elongation factor B [Trichinella pseudospiralis]|uniref:Negative elongation factor B n=2 Tax=Trichinella pseudospiralis TaxID=6337 RepID=A0A0V1FZ30_TRIPS|nr:Negative elongation factor B [Trichinella pseudospiralis]KRY78983.1 Negative elongation factor B [Trichinella pseudospiralis]KRY91319.1 Negative elongation factor B [Trichinella pseudospiralis]KRZ20722.1 Negative elongation factor B [Trichinella pseudospiralis]KRZ45833.1 Negative elongation factor B [Trichinella pseudospiralis]
MEVRSSVERFRYDNRQAVLEALSVPVDQLHESIAMFQQKNAVQLQSLFDALRLLEQNPIRKLDYHETIMRRLREMILEQLNNVKREENGADKIEDFLNTYYELVDLPTMRSLIIDVMMIAPRVPVCVLHKISSDNDLYNMVDLQIKRLIWELREDIFYREMKLMLTHYLNWWLTQFREADTERECKSLLDLNGRRKAEVIQKIICMIGRKTVLYDRLLSYIRMAFLHTKHVVFCNFRHDLLLSFHEADMKDIANSDPCYKFMLALEAFFKDPFDNRNTEQLQQIFAFYFDGDNPVQGDLSIILNSYSSIQALSTITLKLAKDCVLKKILPRECQLLTFAFRLLKIGLGGWKFNREEKSIDQKCNIAEKDYLQCFLPILLKIIAAQHALNAFQAIGNARRVEFFSCADTAHDEIVQFITSDLICFTVFFYYALELIRSGVLTFQVEILTLVAKHAPAGFWHEQNLHILVQVLKRIPDKLWSNASFFDLVFGTLFDTKQRLSKLHALRLAVIVCKTLSDSQLKRLTKLYTPLAVCNDYSQTFIFYSVLMDHIDSDFSNHT